jgi:hypothetical protein
MEDAELKELYEAIKDEYEEEGLFISATDYNTMRLTLEEQGYTVTEMPDVLEVTLDLPEEVEVELDLSPEPTPGESLDAATLNAISDAVVVGHQRRLEAHKKDRAERIRVAVKSEIDYHRGKVRI